MVYPSSQDIQITAGHLLNQKLMDGKMDKHIGFGYNPNKAKENSKSTWFINSRKFISFHV
jgi:hypothetical protein